MRRIADSLGGARGIGAFSAIVVIALLGILLFNKVDSAEDVGEASMEQRLTRILECIDGVGEVHVMISEDAEGAPCGAVVVANEIGSVQAWLEVQSAVQAALGIEVERIRVIGLRGLKGG